MLTFNIAKPASYGTQILFGLPKKGNTSRQQQTPIWMDCKTNIPCQSSCECRL